MNGPRSAMARVEGTHKIKRFRAAHFADNDPAGIQSQACADQVAQRDFPIVSIQGAFGLERNPELIGNGNLPGIFNGNHDIAGRNEGAEAIEQCRLAAARPARNQHVFAKPHNGFNDRGAGPVDGAVSDEILQCQLVFRKLANDNAGAAMVAGIDDDIDAALVRQTGIQDRRSRNPDAAPSGGRWSWLPSSGPHRKTRQHQPPQKHRHDGGHRHSGCRRPGYRSRPDRPPTEQSG